MIARTRVMHDNRLQQRIMRGVVEAHGEQHDQLGGVQLADWEATHLECFILIPQQEQQAEEGRHYPQHIRYHRY